jgi:hypothetical protein
MRANRVAAACGMLLLLAAVQARVLTPADAAHGEMRAIRDKLLTLAAPLARHLTPARVHQPWQCAPWI